MSEAIQPSSFKLRAFAEWVEAKGGNIDRTTNEWEVLRYRLEGNAPLVLYRNKEGRLTISTAIRGHYAKFLNDTGAGGEQAISKQRRANSLPIKRKLASRDALPDGSLTCCYCGQFIAIECEGLPHAEEATLEHFLPVSKGGPNHVENAALACTTCNEAAGNLSVLDKIKLRDRIREDMADHLPWLDFDARTSREART